MHCFYLSFCSFRVLNRSSTVPRALLWAIYLLGFQPVFAVCQFPTINGDEFNVIVQQPMCRAVAGRSPNRIIAQGIRPG